MRRSRGPKRSRPGQGFSRSRRSALAPPARSVWYPILPGTASLPLLGIDGHPRDAPAARLRLLLFARRRARVDRDPHALVGDRRRRLPLEVPGEIALAHARQRRVVGVDDEVRVDPVGLHGVPGGCVVALRREPHPRAAGELEDRLHAPLPEGLRADHLRPLRVLERPGHELRRARGVRAHEHDGRRIDQRAAGVSLHFVDDLRAMTRGVDGPAGEELVRHLGRFVDRPARVIPHVEDDAGELAVRVSAEAGDGRVRAPRGSDPGTASRVCTRRRSSRGARRRSAP